MAVALKSVSTVSEVRYGWDPSLLPRFAVLFWNGPGFYARAVHRNRALNTYYMSIECVGKDPAARASAERFASAQLLEPTVFWAETPEEALAPYRSLGISEEEPC